ncbi:MAG: sigma-70 family RNA polymerase sigma factor [Phycisphaera sp.]|nr:sigma-70 family RNA polymerase sigma factor [Phycisphaera sp.]
MDRPRHDRIEEFIPLFTGHEARVHAYILALLPNWADAEEVLQETNAVLWRKFDEFESGGNYFAWACRIARYEVMNFRRKRQREPLRFSNEFVDAVADEAVEMAAEMDAQQKALSGCIDKLAERDRDLVRRRYTEGATTKAVAAQVGRSAEGVYKAMARIRAALLRCVEHSLAEGGPA